MVKRILHKIKKISPVRSVKEAKKEFQERTATLILGSFGFIAALAWNETIKNLFETLFEKSNQLIGQFIYALLVTLVLVLVSMKLKNIAEKKE